MMEILGLLDTLEATILSGKKILLSDKVILEETKLLEIIDKIRLLLKSDEGLARRTLDKSAKKNVYTEKGIISKAQRESRLIREGANKYADEVLASLLSTVLKLQRTLKNGRDRLEKAQNKEE